MDKRHCQERVRGRLSDQRHCIIHCSIATTGSMSFVKQHINRNRKTILGRSYESRTANIAQALARHQSGESEWVLG